MAKTEIKLLRGQGMPQGYAFVANNAGTLSSCEPWVNTSAKQLWVDNVCINPHLAIGENSYISLAYAQDSTSKEVTLTATLDRASLASYVLGTGHDFKVKYGTNNEDVVYDINDSTADNFIVIGSGLSYDASTNTISNAIQDSFLNGVTLVEGGSGEGQYSGGTAGHTYMTFDFNTAASGAQTIYVDITDFYTDNDTKTQISAPANDDVEVELTSNSGVFTNNGTNTYSIAHKTYNTPTATTGTATTVTNGGTFTAVTGVTTNNGHVTAVESTTFTVPTNVTYDLDADVPTGGTSMNINLKGSDNSTDTVNLKHAAQDNNGVGSKVTFSASNNDITMQIDVIDGGTF